MKTTIKVWDLFIRTFHWSLVMLFTITYLTEDDFIDLHVYAGYVIGALLLFRVLWGFIGSKHARFNDFVKTPKQTALYLADVVRFRAKHYIGHNPAGGAMVIALILSLSITVLSGLLTYGALEFSGPLSSIAMLVSDDAAHLFEETHELFANVTILLIFFHLAGVLIASLQHKENLINSMITGIKNKQ